ncbi:MAG: hypothetical protein ACJATI_002960 [Halioglobus sp.]|jgi:hypothetical protein
MDNMNEWSLSIVSICGVLKDSCFDWNIGYAELVRESGLFYEGGKRSLL